MHIFAFVCLVFLFGCFCGIKFATVNICFVLMHIGFVFGIKLLLFKKKKQENVYALILLAVFCCGAITGILHDRNTFSKISALYGNEIMVTGKVSGASGESFVADTEYGLLKVYNYTGYYVENDMIVKIGGEVSGFEVAQYNGDFDTRLHNALNGIVGYINCDKIEVIGYDKEFSIWDAGIYIRNFIEGKVESFSSSSAAKGFVTALLTGNTDNLDEGLKEDFKVTGISHLTAVSGLHVSIFLSFFVMFSKKLRKHKFFYILFVLVLLITYTLVVGERASVLRAVIMAVVSYVMLAVKRRSDSVVNLMMAGIVICIANPYYVTDPGFQMSFLATLSIVLFSGSFKRKTLAVPVVVSLFMLPVTLFYYNTFSLVTVAVNIIAVPLVPIVILTGYIGCVIPLFSVISCTVADLIIFVADKFASMEVFNFTLPSPDAEQFVMWFMLICAAYFGYNRHQFKNAVAILMCLTVVFIYSVMSEDVPENSYSLRFINDGRHNMEHITTENNLDILVDCGADTNNYAVKNGVNDILLVIITTDDKECYEGLERLCTYQNVRYVLLPDTLRNENLKLEKTEVLYYNHYSHEFTVDGVHFRFTKFDGKRCMLIRFYNHTVAMPFDKEISHLNSYTVMCVPDKCTDVAKSIGKEASEYYIHATYRYGYYDYGNKYITSQVGMVHMIFQDDAKPMLLTP